MAVEVTPRGTRGVEPPTLPAPVMGALRGVFHFMFRRFGNRMRVQGRPLLELETRGSRSNATRFVALGWFPDAPPSDDSWIVVASYAGSARHPAWFLNLARHPDDVWIRVGGQRIRVKPETLNGADRDEAWKRVVALAPGYGAYTEKTDRVIPIIRLTREPRD